MTFTLHRRGPAGPMTIEQLNENTDRLEEIIRLMQNQIEEINRGHTHAINEVRGLRPALDEKQPSLISGVTIKTIGDVSLMGPGNINITGQNNAS